jgi:hypothetical protein
MRNALWIGVGVFVVIALVLLGLVGGWVLWGQNMWTTDPVSVSWNGTGTCGTSGYQMGPGTMNRYRGGGTRCEDTDNSLGTGAIRPEESLGTISIERAYEETEQYVASLGYMDLEIAELMEFERN